MWIVCPTNFSRSYSRTNAKMVEPLFRNVKISSHGHPVHASNNQHGIFCKNKTKVEHSACYHLNQIIMVFMDDGIIKF
jgi:hypothetical protein